MADTVPRTPEEDRPRLTREELDHLLAIARAADDAKPAGWCKDDHVVTPGDTPDQWHVYETHEDDPPFATVDDERLAAHIATFDPPMVETLVALAQRTVAAEDEAARMAGDEEGHLNKVEQMRMRAEQAERTLAAIAEACDKYYGWGGMIEKDTIRRLLQEG